jgi:hypothetical protein
MPTEELNSNYFTRERVRHRMLRRAAEHWGYSESEMDDFDPLVNLLIESCSAEFEKIAGEIGKTQNRMLERLAGLLYPAMIDVNPAYGVLQARSAEPNEMLYPDAQFYYKDFFFSPSRPQPIVDGNILCISSARELFGITDGVQKLLLGSSRKKMPDYQHVVWLGLDLNTEVSSLDGISFFFNWLNQPESKHWYPYLPYTEWLLENTVLNKSAGLAAVERMAEPGMLLQQEFDPMRKMEAHLSELFNSQYITLTSNPTLTQLKARRRPYPAVFEQLFDKKELRELKDPLLWIEIRFPPIVPAEALDTALVSINAIPVINRKLNKFTYKMARGANIVPLETEGTFLAIKEITDSQGQSVKLVPFADPAGLPPETYTLRYGINRFDERDAARTLVSLTDLIREESSFFSSLGEDFLIQHIRELDQILARIDDKIKMHRKTQSPYPYLVIRPAREGGLVMVEYWSCNGGLAGKIPIGSKLAAYKSSSVMTDSLFFITPTYDGRDKLSDTEKIGRYKRSLLTRARIVTLEDLRVFMETELGKSVRSIRFKKIYARSMDPVEGLIQYMQITITPEPGSLEPHEWEMRIRALKLKLENQSVNSIPYLFKLADYDNA